MDKHKNNFVIGIGSQRAGSTLLHKILDSCTDIFMHPIKELHYYDTLFDVRKDEFLKKFISNESSLVLNEIISSKEDFVVDKRLKCHLRSLLLLGKKSVHDIEYMDLYRPLLMDSDFLGEVTPEYMILPEAGISRLACDIGSGSKIILLSRDPVERFISSFKLLKMYGGKTYDSVQFSDDIKACFDQMPAWIEQQDALNDYASTLNLYKKFFDNVLFVSFERMIDDPEGFYRLLSDFLDIEIDKTQFDECFLTKVNQIGNISDKVSDELYSFLSERYKNHTNFLIGCDHLSG